MTKKEQLSITALHGNLNILEIDGCTEVTTEHQAYITPAIENLIFSSFVLFQILRNALQEHTIVLL